MIPRIHTGGSFRGAGLYYLHDKGETGAAERPTTSDRVAWTHARNTVNDAPEAVLREMRSVAHDQQWLKEQSGQRLDGRPCTKPVMTIALAWSPEQAPTREGMIAAGESYLTFMGWQEHQALFVAHNDTAHPHVHLIVNRIHPETGMVLDDSWRKYRSHQWSHAFEKEQGEVLCKEREGKYELKPERERKQSKGKSGRESASYAPGAAKWWRDAEDIITTDHKAEEAADAKEWAGLRDHQKADRLAFWKESGELRKQLFKTVRAHVQDEFKGDWKAYAEKADVKRAEVRLYDREARHIIKHYTRLHAPASIKEVKLRQKEYHARVKAELKAERDQIFERQKTRGEALAVQAQRHLGLERAELYKTVLARHRQEKTELRHDQRDGKDRPDLVAGTRPAPPPAKPVPSFPKLDRLNDTPAIRDAKTEQALRVSGLMRAAGAAARDRFSSSLQAAKQAAKTIKKRITLDQRNANAGGALDQFGQHADLTRPHDGRGQSGPLPSFMQRLGQKLAPAKPRPPTPPGVQPTRAWTDADRAHAEQRQEDRMRNGTPASQFPAAARAQHGTPADHWQLAAARVAEQQRQQAEEAQRQQARALDQQRRAAEAQRVQQPDPARETTERQASTVQREQTDRRQADVARAERMAKLDAFIAKRGRDRAREQEGGRER